VPCVDEVQGETTHTNNTHKMMEVRNFDGDMVVCRKKLDGGEDDVSCCNGLGRHRPM
jgi:hypothetical protein